MCIRDRVVAVGENVKHLQVGDKVAVEPGVPCGECEFCRSGRYNICQSLSFMSSPPNRGAFRRYFEYPANMAYKLPDEVSTLEGCLLEPLAVGLHGAARAGVGLGDNVVIIGAGCVGLTLLLACKARGAAKVILIDIFDNRLAKALELGATAVVNSKNEDPAAKVAELLGGGAHVVFEAVGSPATVELCPQMLRPGGTIACIGSQPSGASYCFPAKYMIMKDVYKRQIKSIALVHEMLSGEEPRNSIINLQSMVARITRFYSMRDVAIDLDVEPIAIPYNKATSIALIVNELISNCFKHAFPEDMPDKHLTVSGRRREDSIQLAVQDNGVGLAPGFDAHSSASLGMQIICIITKEFEGDIRFTADGGTRAELTLPLNKIFEVWDTGIDPA